MKEMKRFLSLMLCLVMLVGMLPVNAFADEAAEAQRVTEATQAVVETAAEGSVDGTESTDKTVTVPGEKTENETTSGEDVVVPEESTDAAEDETVVPEGDDETVAPEGDDETVTPEGDDETVAPEGDDETVAPDGDDAAEDEEIPEETEETVPVKPVRPVILQQVTDEAASGDTVLLAEGESVVVIAGSDYQQNGTAPKTNTQNILAQIVKDYSSAVGFLFGGDYSQTINNSSSTTSGINELKGVVQGVYGTGMSEVYVQGNHDAAVSGLTATGAHDTDYYGVFSINEDDFSSSYTSSGSYSSTMLTELESYLDTKVDAGYKKPIFVATHLPLHATSRNDNNAANKIFTLLNDAGDKGLNIIFLFGHNHSQGYDAYLGNGSIYLPKGSSITVAGGSTSTLNFTYMNNGYVGYVTGNACTHLSMTTFEIYEDEVIIKRYSTDGQHLLKEKGATVSGYNTDANEYGYAVLDLSDGTSTTYDLSTEDSGSGDTGSGDSNTGSGDSDTSGGSTGGNGNVYTLDTDGIDAGEEYLIVSTGSDGTGSALTNNSGTSNGTDVTISGGKITLDNANAVWIFSDAENGTAQNGTTGYYVYPSSTSGEDPVIRDGTCDLIFTHEGNGAYTIQRDSQWSGYYVSSDSDWTYSSSETSVYLYKKTGTGTGGGSTVTPEGGDWVTITAPNGGTTTYTYTQATSITAGGEYVIVGNDNDVALLANGTDMGAQDVTITGNSGSQTMTSTTELTEWTFSGTSNGTVYNGTNYLYSSSNGYTFRIDDSSDTLYFTNNGNNFQIKGSSRYNGYSFYYSGSSWATSGSRTDQYVRLFQLTGSTPGDDATPGLFAKITGTLEHTVERGLTDEEVLDLVTADIKGYEYSGTSAPGADVTGTEITDKLEFVLDSSYDGAKAGQYAVAIKYNGVTLGTAKVIVPDVEVSNCVFDKAGSVKVGASGNVRTGANITVNLADSSSYTVPITMGMLTKDGAAVSTDEAGEITGITVTFELKGKTYTINDFTLTVREPSSYPEYPDEGAVKVNKTGTGIQFQSTGVAQIEVSASGIPMNQGVDVLLVLDTSSSMGFQGSLDSGTRIGVLRTCVDALIKNLKKERTDGSVPDVDIAIADFAGYLLGHDGTKLNNYIGSQVKSTDADDVGAVLTGGWVNVQNLDDNWGTQSGKITQKSGTNYDHGLEQAYNLLKDKQEQDNGTRKQFVLFMSDGAPLQYNGVNSNSLGTDWADWILGNYNYSKDEDGNVTTDIPGTVQNPEFYYGNNNGNGQKHWVAEAIKGNSGVMYDIVYHTNYTYGEATMAKKEVQGLGATMYSVGLALEASNMPTDVAGQEAILTTIASSPDLFYSVTSAAGLQNAFDDFAGEVLMAATNARFVDKMGAQYDLQMGTIKDLYGNAVAGVDNKIEILSYEIWTRSDYLAGNCTLEQIGDRKLDADGKPIATVLETITFNADGTEVYSDKINNGQTNILGDGTQEGFARDVIYAKNFMYNNGATAIAVDGVDIPTGVDEKGLTTGSTNMLPAETFYWNVGTIKTTELAMRYYVYLEGSMEGTCEPGSYPTNEYANLYYNNYLDQPTGQPCQKPTFSPVMAWDAANVSYAFYLVDENGNIVVNQTTGETGSFANKIAVTNPVVYKEVLLNNVGNVESIEVASLGVLPAGYELYDDDAVYTVQIKSDATGSWNIKKGDVSKASTYVTHYDLKNSAAYSNALTKDSNADFTHTVVWFAVLWKIQALPDSVVVDYGLPVDISVLTNDMFGENGKLAGVGPVASATLDGHTAALNSGFDNEYKAETAADDTLKYGDAAVLENGKVRYTLNTMSMDGYDQFAYAANYTGATNPGYYYDTVTVIPATTIYYEDNFLSFETLKWTATEGGEAWEGSWSVNPDKSVWSQAGTVNNSAVQEEDRPGKYALTDANNIYGYDDVNLSMSTYSLGSAMKAAVDYDNGARASFDFTGTGFDVISMTDATTGTIWVKVYPVNTDGSLGDAVKNFVVDTYYGYKQADCHVVYTCRNTGTEEAPKYEWIMTDVLHESSKCDGKCTVAEGMPAADADSLAKEIVMASTAWVVDSSSNDAIWQVPVMKITNLPYGKYRGVIEAVYEPGFDHVDGSNTYDFYMDAIRIYDPANDGASDGSDDKTIENAYIADGEGWPSYIELRNKLISANSFDKVANDKLTEDMEGLVFIDGDATVGNAQLADYVSYGPNNEVYLAKNQSVAFLLGNADNAQSIHLGVKSADGRDVTYTIKNIAQKKYSENGVDVGDEYNEKTYTLNTTTDMYYDITGWKNDIIVITNTSDSILSLTNIKATYKSDPNAAVVTTENGDSSVPAPDSQSTSNQEVYAYMTPAAATLTLRSMNNVVEEPEETQPDESVPETTVPNPSEPEPSDPETSEPEESIPETTVPEKPADKQEQFQQAMKEAVTNMVNNVKKALKSLFGKWFR